MKVNLEDMIQSTINIIDHISVNRQNIKFVQKWNIKLLSLADEIQDNELHNFIINITNELQNIIAEKQNIDYESSINQIISTFREKIKNMLEVNLYNISCTLKNRNINDFYIIEFFADRMVLAGTFDRGYYHEVEINFHGVEYICMPTDGVSINNFRLANQDEINDLKKVMYDYNQSVPIICLEDTFDETKYYVVANQVTCNWGLVYYYNRENLSEGERIADWVKVD